MNLNPDVAAQMLQGMLQPWYKAVEAPSAAQEKLLPGLVADYAKTKYGQDHNASQVGSLEDYRRCFPIITYETIRPTIERVMAGEDELLLWEQPLGWAITRHHQRRVEVHSNDTYRHSPAAERRASDDEFCRQQPAI